MDIYAHILRQFYPGEVVMRITGRDCGIVRNPFAGGVKSLHIWFAKNDPDARLSDETAYHKDQFGAIPDGDALDFAELYWHQSGQELLQTINRELYLHLDVDNVQYSSSHPVKVEKVPKFSFFKAPVTNKFSFKSITPLMPTTTSKDRMQRKRQSSFVPSIIQGKPESTRHHILPMSPSAGSLMSAPTIRSRQYQAYYVLTLTTFKTLNPFSAICLKTSTSRQYFSSAVPQETG